MQVRMEPRGAPDHQRRVEGRRHAEMAEPIVDGGGHGPQSIRCAISRQTLALGFPPRRE